MKVRTLVQLLVLALLLVALRMDGPQPTAQAVQPPTDPASQSLFDCGNEAITKISQGECNALVAFYNLTNGPGWNTHENWLSIPSPCADYPQRWVGVMCECSTGWKPQCRVNGLQLSHNNITGEIPEVLGNLPHLVWLYLGENSLEGHIPGSLGNLKKLESLVLQNNKLDGPIPAGLAGATSLRSLFWAHNQLDGGLAVLANLHNLKIAFLSYSNFGGLIPPELGTLYGLEQLSLAYNNLKGEIPPELGGTEKSLTYLNLSRNQLWGSIPPEIFQLPKLETLQVSTNTLTGGLPPMFGSTLKKLDVSSNRLSGLVPQEIHQNPFIYHLILSNNNFSGPLPRRLGELTSLQTLRLDNNPALYGVLPVGLKNAGGLTSLWYQATGICEPQDAGLQAKLWELILKGGLKSSGLRCTAAQVSQQIGPSGGTLSSPDDGTVYTFRPGTFGAAADATVASTAAVTVTHAPGQQGSAPALGSLVGIRHFYDAYARNASGQYVQPSQPYTITITYNELDLRSSRARENTLALYRWNGTAWVKEPTSRVDAAANRITATPSRFSTWAVLGKPFTIRVLPEVMKQAVR